MDWNGMDWNGMSCTYNRLIKQQQKRYYPLITVCSITNPNLDYWIWSAQLPCIRQSSSWFTIQPILPQTRIAWILVRINPDPVLDCSIDYPKSKSIWRLSIQLWQRYQVCLGFPCLHLSELSATPRTVDT